MLVFGWMFYKKIPTIQSCVGSTIIMIGVGLFVMANYYEKTNDDTNTNIIGVACSISSLTAYSLYSYGQEIFLKQYPMSSNVVIGIMGAYSAIIGAVPVMILNLVGYEKISKITLKPLLLIIINSILTTVFKYINWIVIDKTSAFLFATIFVLTTPLGLFAQISQEKIDKKEMSFSWYYIPPIILIIIGCMLVTWQTKEEINSETPVLETEKTTSGMKNTDDDQETNTV